MQDEEDGDEIPDEDEAGVGAAGAAKVTVTVPTDFTLSESCQELLDTLCGVRALAVCFVVDICVLDLRGLPLQS